MYNEDLLQLDATMALFEANVAGAAMPLGETHDFAKPEIGSLK